MVVDFRVRFISLCVVGMWCDDDEDDIKKKFFLSKCFYACPSLRKLARCHVHKKRTTVEKEEQAGRHHYYHLPAVCYVALAHFKLATRYYVVRSF